MNKYYLSFTFFSHKTKNMIGRIHTLSSSIYLKNGKNVLLRHRCPKELLAGIAQKPMSQVFLDVRKSFDPLDRGWCMDILMGYGMGQNMVRLIYHH